MTAKLCLNMIVRNEADKIGRALRSAVPFIDSYAILDTGSTDGTVEIIEKFFSAHGIPGRVSQGEFINFEQARNEALFLAQRSTADYILLMDADMELMINDWKFREKLNLHAYNVSQKGGAISYYNTRLVKRDFPSMYRGVTHEYLDTGTEAVINNDIYFIDHADGTNRAGKFERDIKLLLTALEKEPNNGRYWYYLGQSYRDNKQFKEAAAAYKKRMELGGWDEETWSAHSNYAHCLNNLGDEDGFLREMLAAHNFRPSRAETLYELANHYRLKNGQQHTALMFAKQGMSIPRPNDQLFVSDWVYRTGLRVEYSICAFYNPRERDNGFKVCDELSRDPGGDAASKNEARENLFHYIKPLAEVAPSFTTQQIDFVPPKGYVAMNPSVTMHQGRLWCNVRCVNYTIDRAGRYLIRNTETGEITNDCPIHTRNFLVRLGLGHKVRSHTEIVAQNLPAPEYGMVRGFEDVRLFSFADLLFANACVREMNKDGWCEQILLHLNNGGGAVDAWCRMLPPGDPQHQKNWMPIIDTAIHFGYRVGKFVDAFGRTTLDRSEGFGLDYLSGGTQYVPFDGGWLGVVHEARTNPNTKTRYYQHRFVWLNEKRTPTKISRPFVFHDKEIEFAAGLTISAEWVVVSYGRRDAEAWIGCLRDADVRNLLNV